MGYKLTQASFEASLHGSESDDAACCQAPQPLQLGKGLSYKHITHGLKSLGWRAIKKKNAVTHKYGKWSEIWDHTGLFHTSINVNRPWSEGWHTNTHLCPTHLVQSDVGQGTKVFIDIWKQTVNLLKRLACKLHKVLFSHSSAQSSQSCLNTTLNRLGQYKYYKLWLATKDLIWAQQKKNWPAQYFIIPAI